MTTITQPATPADFERILAEIRKLLRRAPPEAFSQLRAAVGEMQTDVDARKSAGDFEALT